MTLGNDNGTDRQTDGQTVRRNMRPPPREEGRIISIIISRQDRKRLDGLTRIPWHAGRALVWDVTGRVAG